MCIISFIFDPTADIVLKLIANRDEFYNRPTQALCQWAGDNIIAGQDLQAGGTWLGMSANGRMAALTNHRNPSLIDPNRPSRGKLVVDFLNGQMSSQHYIDELAQVAGEYNPFNLLCFDQHELIGFESRQQQSTTFSQGIYVVSNADFDSPWPKSLKLKSGLASIWTSDDWPDDNQTLKTELFSLLTQTDVAHDDELPKTGIPLDRERQLSATFINTPDYGTCSSSLLALSKHRGVLIERTYRHQDVLGEREISNNIGV